MTKHTLGIAITICAAGLVGSAARAGSIASYSIVAGTLNVAPGDIDDSFEVLLTNNTLAPLNVDAFAFQVSVPDTDITFVNADFSTTPDAYIFPADNSFDQVNGFTLYMNTLPAQLLNGSDLTNDGTDVMIGPGDSAALGEVYFDVANDAAAGPFTISFTGGTDFNNLVDAEGDLYDLDTSAFATGSIASSTPEPSTVLLLGGALTLLGLLRRAGTVSPD
jgi:hypothetical protein